jgi:hypothetical protein
VLRCVIIGIVIRTVAELGVRWLQLWVYRRPHYPIVNVVAIFGIIMGSIATLVPSLGHRHAAIVVAIALLWGFVPLLITAVQAVAF